MPCARERETETLFKGSLKLEIAKRKGSPSFISLTFKQVVELDHLSNFMIRSWAASLRESLNVLCLLILEGKEVLRKESFLEYITEFGSQCTRGKMHRLCLPA